MSAMSDPFQAAPDPALYVARRASERAATEFERGLFQTLEAVVVLIGPPGIGKSVVLAEVARRLEGRCTCVTVGYAGLPLPELCKWVLRELEAGESHGDAGSPNSAMHRLRSWMRRAPTRERDPEGALVERALELERSGRPLVVLIDDADDMEPRTAAALARLAGRAQGALFIGIASCDDRLLASAGKRSVAVQLSEPMTHEETARYVTTRLERAGASRELRVRLDRDCIARLHAYAQGNPRRVHGEISLIQIELESRRQRAAGDPPSEPPRSAFVPAPPARSDLVPVPAAELARPSDTPALPPEPVIEPTRPTPVRTAADDSIVSETSSRTSGPVRLLGAAVLAGGIGWFMGSTLDAQGPRNADVPAAAESAGETLEASVGADAAPGESAAAPEVLTVSVNINADPWAKIWIDGREVGDTPLADVPLAIGEHRFRVVFEKGRVVERTIDVDREQRFISFP
jgi:hypothetical protein